MADTPETPPANTNKPADQAQSTEAGTSSTPLSGNSANSAGANGSASQGWAAQVAPLKAQAEKAARSAVDKLNTVDWKAQVDPLKEQAAQTARSAAGLAKDKTGSAMQSLARLITDTAGTVDAKLGPQYGDYARQAAEAVAGAADTLDSKDVDQLMTEARDFVRKSPAVAIGAAAVVGFVLMRLAKGPDDKDKA